MYQHGMGGELRHISPVACVHVNVQALTSAGRAATSRTEEPVSRVDIMMIPDHEDHSEMVKKYETDPKYEISPYETYISKKTCLQQWC